MNAWIFSTEPATFPWSRVESETSVRWDGIRGPRARLSLRAISSGDTIWGYHTSPEKSLVCRARAKGTAYPDPADEHWLAVDVTFESWLKNPIPLAALRSHPALSRMDFIRIPRLSVAPLTESQNKVLWGLSNGESPR
ncbi:MAG: EVE domain-containing protein [Elusimicrobia bacterium]|nr:EVE domain-containing protein [Elusimicrobiota bacterium]